VRLGARTTTFAAILMIAAGVYSCRTADLTPIPAQSQGSKVSFFAQDGGSDIQSGKKTKTAVAPNGVSMEWTAGDKTCLWAKKVSDRSEVLSAVEFTLAGKSGGKAEFSANLAAPMQEGRYYYTACYPYPENISNTDLTFNLPARQDGSGKEAILISSESEGDALVSGKSPSESMCLQMNHICHILRFYLPEDEDPFEGDPIRSLNLEFSSPVVGKVVYSAYEGVRFSLITSNPYLLDGSKSVSLDLGTALEKGGFACAVICPTDFTEGGTLQITASTDNWEGFTAPISLGGRNFKAGHCTPVPIVIKEKKANFSIDFVLKENNIGEPQKSISVGDYVYSPGKDIPVGSVIKLRFDSEEEFRKAGGTDKIITFESEHVIAEQTVRIPDLSSGSHATVEIRAPYLLDENFDTVNDFSSNDEYSTSSVGSKDAVSFLKGWTGARIGGQTGKCIRIAGHRESGMWIDAHYPARVESTCLPTIKSAVDVELDFDYGTNCDGIDKYGQIVYVGYVTSTSAYKSSDTTGEYPEQFTASAQDGSYDSTPNKASYTLSIPAGSSIRISWRNDPEEHKDFASNTTSWLYIDNIKVKIKQ